MLPLLVLPLCLLQAPAPVHCASALGGQAPMSGQEAPVSGQQAQGPVEIKPDPRARFAEFAARLRGAKVLHLVADGILVTTDPEHPEISRRWTFSTEVWMAKGGRVQARTRWTGPKPAPPSDAAPEQYTSIVYADGSRLWQGFEDGEPLRPTELASARFVPHPLPEVFGFLDAKPEVPVPAAVVGETFDWGEPVRTMPTAIVLDPEDPAGEPATWYGFGERELAGWCTMMPERLGGDVVRGKFARIEWLERLPEKDPPRFVPPGFEAK